MNGAGLGWAGLCGGRCLDGRSHARGGVCVGGAGAYLSGAGGTGGIGMGTGAWEQGLGVGCPRRRDGRFPGGRQRQLPAARIAGSARTESRPCCRGSERCRSAAAETPRSLERPRLE